MDDGRIGRALRRIRIEKGWRQADVAARAGVSQRTYGDVELGRIESVTHGTLRRIASALGAEVSLDLRYRGATLAILLSARHAVMTEAVARLLTTAGWEVRPEVSFSHFGERGVVDLVARHASGAVLLVELKTELADINDILANDDRRRRLAPVIVAPLGWRPAHVSSWLVLAPSVTNHRRLAAHATALRAVFPRDGRAVAGWLRSPTGPVNALWFLSDSAMGATRSTATATRRVSGVRKGAKPR